MPIFRDPATVLQTVRADYERQWHLTWLAPAGFTDTFAMMVRGDVAGTSARLQPAEVHVHWDKVSLADLFRLFRGQDYGVRGIFSLDGTAKSDVDRHAVVAHTEPGEWTFSLQARAAQIHRWDLSERSDNPAATVNLEGGWNAGMRTISAIALRSG